MGGSNPPSPRLGLTAVSLIVIEKRTCDSTRLYVGGRCFLLPLRHCYGGKEDGDGLQKRR